MKLVTRTPTVFLVDEDAGSVQSIQSMLEPTGLPLRWFAFPSEFLEDYCEDTPGCLILDLRRPGADGLDVLERIAAKGANLPTIVITGDGDVRSCARAFKMGVLDFLQKPIDRNELLACVTKAVAHGAGAPACPLSRTLSEVVGQLTPREKSVLELLVTGRTLKEIAARYGVTVQSVWKHQQHILHKFNVQNEVELANLMRS